MANFSSRSEAQILENYRVALENVETQTEIAAALTDFGYDNTVIANGKQLHEAARQAYDSNKIEGQESTTAYSDFTEKLKAVESNYWKLRKKAKIVFRNNPVILKNLGLTGFFPHPYIKKVETIKTLLNGLQADSELLGQLTRLKVTSDDITAALAAVTELETARATYLRESGESQQATLVKDNAMSSVEDWMKEFYAVARIALEDKPQLLESLNILVRS